MSKLPKYYAAFYFFSAKSRQISRIYLFIYLFFKEIGHTWTLLKILIAIILTSFVF